MFIQFGIVFVVAECIRLTSSYFNLFVLKKREKKTEDVIYIFFTFIEISSRDAGR